MNAGIAIDKWKLGIFERHLTQNGYSYENKGALVGGTVLLVVETENVDALGIVVHAAEDEARKTGRPSETKPGIYIGGAMDREPVKAESLEYPQQRVQIGMRVETYNARAYQYRTGQVVHFVFDGCTALEERKAVREFRP